MARPKFHIHPFFAFFTGCIVSSAFFLIMQRGISTSNFDDHQNIYHYDNHPQDSSVDKEDGQRMLQFVNNRYNTESLTQASKEKPIRMLLGIFTTIEEVERRQKLRDYIFKNPTRADPRLCSLNEFLMDNNDLNNFHSDISPRYQQCQIIYTFIVGANTSRNAPLYHTHASNMPILVSKTYIPNVEPDVVYLNIKENMNRGKTPTWFKYATMFNDSLDNYVFDYIAKIDSDVLLSIPNLLDMINNNLPREPKNVYGGILCDERACGDPKRCFKVLQGKVYMTGQFYFLSHDLARYISNDKLDRAGISLYSEDVDLAMWVHSSKRILNLIILNNKNVFWVHNAKELTKMDAKYNDYFVKQRKFPKYSFWLKPNWWD